MNRTVNIPIWFCIVVIVLLCYIAFIVPFIGELNRQAAVTNLKNPSTEEHNRLGQFLVDTFMKVIQSSREDRFEEHFNMTLRQLDIKNDTQTIIAMLKNNGTD